MKNTMGMVLGVVFIAALAGCQKKEVKAPIEEPIVTEETAANSFANLELNAMNIPTEVNAVVVSVPSALEAASNAVEQVVAVVVENPTNQQIQEALKNSGFYDGKVDGSIGPKTKRAIEKFQSENGLKPDGKVGPKTWAKLGVHLSAGVIESATTEAAPVTEPILESDPMNVIQDNITK